MLKAPANSFLGRLASVVRPTRPLLRVAVSPRWARFLIATGAKAAPPAGDSMEITFPPETPSSMGSERTETQVGRDLHEDSSERSPGRLLRQLKQANHGNQISAELTSSVPQRLRRAEARRGAPPRGSMRSPIPRFTLEGVTETDISMHPFTTEDGLGLYLTRFRRVDCDDVVLVLHGLTASSDMFWTAGSPTCGRSTSG